MGEALFRVVGIIDAVQTIEVNKIRRIDDCSSNSIQQSLINNLSQKFGENLKPEIEADIQSRFKSTKLCYIIEFAIQVELNSKLVNGESLETSLNEATQLTLTELRYLLEELPEGRTLPTNQGRKRRQNTVSRLSTEQLEQIKNEFQKAKIIGLQRVPARLPGRNAALYFGAMLAVFTIAYK